MYYFMVENIECRCDTIDELHAAMKWRASDIGTNRRASPKRTAKRKVKQSAKANKSKPKRKITDAIRKLPYVEGGITWPVTKKIAKELGRKDTLQLRSDLKTRKDLGK